MIRIPLLRPGIQQAFPAVERALDSPNGLLAGGGDLSCERLLSAYRRGIFPWFSDGEPILWWSPDPRMVFATDAMHVPDRLRRFLRRCDWDIRIDTAFTRVLRACAEPRRDQPGTWIVEEMMDAYGALHALGHAHSVEVWNGDALVGGIYFVAIGRMAFGESMFSRATNGSKVALLALCAAMRAWQCPLLDAQVSSPHLLTLGAREMRRRPFCERVAELVAQPMPAWRDFPALKPRDLASI